MKRQGLISTGFHIPYNPKLKERAREMRKNMTEPERKLWLKFLRNQKKTFLRQKPLDNYIVDFYCASNKLIIEIDGDSHFNRDGKSYDEERTAVLKSYGLELLRFTNDEVIKNFENVCEKISSFIEKNPPTPFSKGGFPSLSKRG